MTAVDESPARSAEVTPVESPEPLAASNTLSNDVSPGTVALVTAPAQDYISRDEQQQAQEEQQDREVSLIEVGPAGRTGLL